tara:strand:+ start:3174 stop:4127 length:954 start_codon:yes stop_codon:yes gene_type:complete
VSSDEARFNSLVRQLEGLQKDDLTEEELALEGRPVRDRFAVIKSRQYMDLLPYAKEEMISPLDQARKTYGDHGLGALISRRSQAYFDDEVGRSLPSSVERYVPSMRAGDWSTEIPVGTMEDGYRMRDATGMTVSYPGMKEDGIGIIVTGKLRRDSADRAQQTLDHEMTHGLQFLKENRWESEGRDQMEAESEQVGYKANYSPDGYYKERFLANQDIDRESKEFTRGWESAADNEAEAVAYLNAAVRVYARENGRPPETEDEVVEALDMTLRDKVPSERVNYQRGMLSGLKEIPWVKRLGMYLVDNRPLGSTNEVKYT